MFGFSTADWLFIGFILVVIVVCVAISDMRKRKGGPTA
jgi:disulfide bond formation protein DsbB